MFHLANQRQQLIVSASFNEVSKAKYDALKRSNPTEPLILVTKQKVLLKNLVERCGRFKAQIMTQASYVPLNSLLVYISLGDTDITWFATDILI